MVVAFIFQLSVTNIHHRPNANERIRCNIGKIDSHGLTPVVLDRYRHINLAFTPRAYTRGPLKTHVVRGNPASFCEQRGWPGYPLAGRGLMPMEGATRAPLTEVLVKKC
jgi:hypothetical protein